ncbi:MAG: peptidoglycan-binding protein [Thermodesulfobacteriota bacterium]
MSMLHRGSKGEDVRKIQKKLDRAGFSPGEIDGVFGRATELAVINFQRSEGLLVDGIVGPETVKALFKKKIPAEIRIKAEDITPRISINFVSKVFNASSKVKRNIQKHLPLVLKALRQQKLTDRKMVLMALATIRAETGGFEPISEFKSKFNTSPKGHPFDLYDYRKDLGNRGKPDGESFKGRGFVQLTGRDNYTKFSKKLGIGKELVKNPDKANNPLIAARLLALFLKDNELTIKDALLRRSYKEARKLVNGGTHGLQVFRDTYIKGERLLK